MKFKRLLFSILVLPVAFIAFSSTLHIEKDITAANVIILPNGNWDFGYESDDDIESYYASLTGYTGQAFTDKLSDIISANAVKITYGGETKETGDRLRYTDESPRDSSKVVLLYSGHDLEKSKLNQSSKWTWNQEHTWAKSHGFDTKSWNAYSDLHHLRPTYEYINSTRSNLDFGEVENYSGTVKTTDLYGSKVISGTVFEPRDAVKGDVARIMMYMDVRYAGKKSNDPTLILNNSTSTGESSGTGYFGNLQTLLKWHNEDPVDDLEKRRNDRIYEIQKNRNPFIDHPEYIEQVYNTPYAGGGSDSDQQKADEVIAAISNLGTITLDSLLLIDSVNEMYSNLTRIQKELVTNYNILLEAITTYESLLFQQKINRFEELITSSSIMFKYSKDSNQLIDDTMAIRFGTCIDKNLYDELLLMGSEVEFGVLINGAYQTMIPVQVSYAGAKDEDTNGLFYQFAAVLYNISLENIDTKITATVFVRIDGEYYYMEDISKSFIDIAENNLLSEDPAYLDHTAILNYILSLRD